MNIVLIGFRGTGKTILGKKLAQLFDRELIDTDKLIEQKAGKTINEIFAESSEQKFRDLERGVISKLSETNGAVIACGGGAVLDNRNVENLRRNGKIFLLKASASTIHSRIKNENYRPALTNKLPLEEIKHLLEVRSSAYKSAADFEIDAEQPIEKVLEEIVSICRKEAVA